LCSLAVRLLEQIPSGWRRTCPSSAANEYCRDKGEGGYERYVALGILGRNLQTLGTILLNKELKRHRIRLKEA